MSFDIYGLPADYGQRYLEAVALVTEAIHDGMSPEWVANVATAEPVPTIRALVHLVIDTASARLDDEAGVLRFTRERAVALLRDLARHVAVVDADP